tara:strand:- start:120 stop:515 length:396 start_codon:yes stop_codon:yes gene_type:complete
VKVLQFLAVQHKKLDILPFMHIKGSPRIIHQDYGNLCGYGPRAINLIPVDRRKFIMLAKSMEEFLERHVEKLQKDWYMTLRGNIETYAMNPTDPGAYGSITKSNNGIMISAHAYYNHLISEFDSCSDPLNN